MNEERLVVYCGPYGLRRIDMDMDILETSQDKI